MGSHFNEMAGKVLGMLVFVHELQISIWFKKKNYKKNSGCYSCELLSGNGGEIQWCFSQVKGSIEEEVADGKFPSLPFLFFRN